MSSTRGFTELKISCDSIANGLPDAIMQILLKIAASSAQQIKRVAPVDTGFMRDEVKVDTPANNAVRIKANAYYSIFVDKGHQTRSGSLVPANPFFSTEVDRLEKGGLKEDVSAGMDAFFKSRF